VLDEVANEGGLRDAARGILVTWSSFEFDIAYMKHLESTLDATHCCAGCLLFLCHFDTRGVLDRFWDIFLDALHMRLEKPKGAEGVQTLFILQPLE
jgi:hypothetical protein